MGRQSSNRNSACDPDRSESKSSKNSKSKEKKTSFIKEWQKDLKEFFSLRKKKSTVENNDKTLENKNDEKEIDSDYKDIEFAKNGLAATDMEIKSNGNEAAGEPVAVVKSIKSNDTQEEVQIEDNQVAAVERRKKKS